MIEATLHSSISSPKPIAAPVIAIAINTAYTGKYKGPNWGGFNDGFRQTEISIADLAAHITAGYAIAPICHGRRKADNFVMAQHIGLDFDTETDACRLDTLERDPFIAQYAAILHTTSSHTPDKPRARVIFPLDQAVTDPDEIARYVAALLDRFDMADQSASDPARCFFGAVDCELRTFDNVLPVNLLRTMADEHAAQLEAERGPVIPYTPPTTELGADRARNYGLAALAGIANTIATTTEGTRHSRLYTSARRVSVLVREGLINESEGRAALAAAAHGTDNERDIERTITDGIAKGRGDRADWLPNFDDPTATVPYSGALSDPINEPDFIGSMADFIQETFGDVPDLPTPEPEPLPELLHDQPRDPNVRTQAWHWSEALRELLLGVYAETDDRGKPKWGDISDLRAGIMVLETVITAENSGRIDVGAKLSERDIVDLFPHGETRSTARSGISILREAESFCRESPKENKYLNTLGDFQQKPKRGNGERGANIVYMLRDPDVAIDSLVEIIADNALRAEVYAPPGEPLFTPDHLRENAPYNLTRDELTDARQQRQPLLDDYAAERAAAETRIRRAARVLRQRFYDAMQPANPPANPIPDDWSVRNKTEYSAALDRLRFEEAGGFRIEPDKATCQAVGLRNKQQLRRIREINEIVTDARYTNHTITRGIPVVQQVPDYALRRGWGLHLEASNGETFKVAAQTLPRDSEGNYSTTQLDNWIDRQYALGAKTITAKEQISSLERPANEAEKQALAERREQRKAKAADYRAERKHQEQHQRHPAAAPDETPINQHSEFYARKQALFGLVEHTDYEMRGDKLVNRVTLDEWHDPTVQTLCKAWAGTLEGAVMPYAHHSELRERDDEPPPPIVIDRSYVLLSEWDHMPDTQQNAVVAEQGKSKFNRQKDNSPGIEWAKWSWNPVTGCLHACDYCYARDIAARFYTQGFALTLHPGRLCAPTNTKVPKQTAHDASYKNVFTCSMADLFGKWVPSEWIQAVLNQIRANPQWNFLVLTKFPIRMADFEFPENAWVGTTVDRQYAVDRAEKAFSRVNAAVKFLSCEPMLEPLQFSSLSMFDWVIIGGASKSTQTPAFKPPLDWVRNLEAQARAAECMIFEKENLGIAQRLREFPVSIEPTAMPDPDWSEALKIMRELGASYTRGIR